jgi:hypothetical protein
MIDRLIRAARHARHMRQCRAVLATPPVLPRDDGVIVFSMMGTRVLLPYLVAVKSFMQSLQRGRVALIDDGSLTDADRLVLAAHLGDPPITALSAIETAPCPRGGTWERLLHLLDLSRDTYVIQLDSDTVTVGDVPEVRAAIDAGRCFTLLGGKDAQAAGLQPVGAFRAAAYPGGPDALSPADHVQVQFEARADLLPHAAARYVRACSGFAGFAPGAIARAAAEAFSRDAERLVGAETWTHWGSEQITSNFLIANSADPLLLPYARYYNFWDDGERTDPALIHFVGTHRYTGNAYARATATALARLNG